MYIITMKLIVYKDIAIGKFTPQEYKSLNLRAVKNFVDKNKGSLEDCDGTEIREVLKDATSQDFLVIDLLAKTVEFRHFYPNTYTYTVYEGDEHA